MKGSKIAVNAHRGPKPTSDELIQDKPTFYDIMVNGKYWATFRSFWPQREYLRRLAVWSYPTLEKQAKEFEIVRNPY